MATGGGKRKGREAQYETAAYREIQSRLAANVRRVRERNGLTQEEAAHRCGMTTRLFVRVEHAESNWTLTTLARLIEGLGVEDVRDLLGPIRQRAGSGGTK